MLNENYPFSTCYFIIVDFLSLFSPFNHIILSLSPEINQIQSTFLFNRQNQHLNPKTNQIMYKIIQIHNITKQIIFKTKQFLAIKYKMIQNNIQINDLKQKQSQSWSKKYIAVGIVGCFGGLIHHLINGSLYQWGIINIYVTSYFKTIDPSVTLQNNAIAFPIMMFCIGITMKLGIYLAELTHPLLLLVVCQLLISLTVFIASFMTNMWAFIFFYGILFGLLAGLQFMISIIQINKYFPDKKMYVNGIILIGTGIGSVIFGMFSFTYLNPQRLNPNMGYYIGSPQLEEIVGKVPSLIKYLALMYLLIGLVGIFMMAPVILQNRKKQNKELENIQNKRNLEGNVVLAKTQDEKPREAKTLCQAFSSLIFWIKVAIVFLTACGLFLMNGNYKTYVKKNINDDYFLTLIGVIGAVCNGCSRFFWNLVFSKTGFKTVMLMIIGISIVVYSTIRFTVDLKQIYLIEILLINTCIGGLLVVKPTVTQAIYGQKIGSDIYGFYWKVIATANFMSYIFVSNLSTVIGFDFIIYICLGMAALAVPLVMFTKFQGPWKNSTTVLEYCVGTELCKVAQKQQNSLQKFQQSLREHQIARQKQKLQMVKESPSKVEALGSSSEQQLQNKKNVDNHSMQMQVQMSYNQIEIKPKSLQLHSIKRQQQQEKNQQQINENGQLKQQIHLIIENK